MKLLQDRIISAQSCNPGDTISLKEDGEHIAAGTVAHKGVVDRVAVYELKNDQGFEHATVIVLGKRAERRAPESPRDFVHFPYGEVSEISAKAWDKAKSFAPRFRWYVEHAPVTVSVAFPPLIIPERRKASMLRRTRTKLCFFEQRLGGYGRRSTDVRPERRKAERRADFAKPYIASKDARIRKLERREAYFDRRKP